MSPAQRKRQKAGRKMAEASVSNTAPLMTGSGPLHTTAESLKALRQNKHNPLPFLKPEMLSRALEAFEHGQMREAALLWEKMAERDDMLASVKPKREKDVSQLGMQVVPADDTEVAAAHQAVLEKFWNSVRAVNAYDRNERGGFRRLVKQMMTAVSYRYAAHHILWQPMPDGQLRATFEFVPLWLFENTTGKLRYLRNAHATAGEPLEDSEWMITTGDGLMISCSIGYLAKRSAFNDWLVFSEKFAVPGVLGRTSAAAGSPEAQAMTAATQAFGHDWCAVITGDDGTHAEPIKIIQAAGNPSGMPMPAVIEAVNRRMASVYRGADLSSMSSGGGQGTGASLQEKETDILLRDDAETIGETLAEVSRMVIEWSFGNGVEPQARVELIVPVQEDSTSVVTAATLLADRGAQISSTALMDRLNLPQAKDAGDALGKMQSLANRTYSSPPRKKEEIPNAAGGEEGGMQSLRKALAADMQPLGEALQAAYESKDFAAMTGALKKISKEMPELAGDARALSLELAVKMADAWVGGAEDVSNSGNSEGSRKGWEKRRANGWTSKKAAAQIARGTDSMRVALASQADVLDAMDVPGLGQVDFRWGNERGGIRHILEKHGEADAMQVPAMLFSGELMMGQQRAWVSGPNTYVLLTNNLNGTPTSHWVITGYFRGEGPSDA